MGRLPVPGLPIECQPVEVLAAMLIWGEARGESIEGKMAVLWVAVNRALARKCSLATVILQPWQFSSFNADDPNRSKLLEPLKHDTEAIWEVCWNAAQAVLNRTEPDVTRGADHYCTEAIWNGETKPGFRVQWYHRIEIESGRTVETARIGRHVFARCA